MQAKENIQEIYSLTPLQEGFLFHALANKNSDAYFMQSSFVIEGKMQEDFVVETLNVLFKRHDILRTSFVHEGLKKAFQVVLKERKPVCSFNDIRQYSANEQVEILENFRQEDRNKKFDLTHDVLMRVAVFQINENKFEFIWSRHHIIMDGWCMGLLMKEFSEIYEMISHNVSVNLPAVGQYRSFVKWTEKQNKAEAQSYWKGYLDNYSKTASLASFNQTLDANTDYSNREKTVIFTKAETLEIKKFAVKNQVTLNSLIQTVWGIILSKITDSQDVVFGTVVSVRPSEIPTIENIIGLFINTLPVRIKYEAEETFLELVKKVQSENLNKENYQHCSLADIQSETSLKQNLLTHVLTFDASIEREDENNLNPKSFKIVDAKVFAQVSYPFSIVVVPNNHLTIKFNYNGNSYPDSYVESIANIFGYLFRKVLKFPEMVVEDFQILSYDTQQELLRQYSPEFKSGYSQLSLWEMFEASVKQNPENVALITQERTYTYAQLNQKIDRMANYLSKEMEVCAGEVVGVWHQRNAEALISMWAIWKAGAVYLPLDVKLPNERVQFLLKDSKAKAIITESTFLFDIVDFEGKIFATDLQMESLPEVEFEGIREAKDLAYLIFTSGTTGEPKGVPIRHLSMVNRALYHIEALSIKPEDKVLQFASLSFDASIIETTMTLLAGATLVLAEDSVKVNTDLLSKFIDNQGVNIAILPPVYLREMVNESLPTLNRVITTGEKANLEASLIWAKAGKTMLNGYGPTETCVGATFHKIDPARENEYRLNGSIPIGKPFSYTRCYVLDSQQRLLPEGTIGEICVSGVGLSEGYFQRKDLSNEKFVNNLFSGDVADSMLYKTGDLGRWNQNGELEYIGRKDEQVQIRGIRVELGEVENQIKRIEGVVESLVIAKEIEATTTLIGYVILAHNQTVTGIRKELTNFLPHYMIPTAWVTLNTFPLTSNGKIDTKALPKPDWSWQQMSAYVEPQNETESTLQTIWQEVIGKNQIGIKDNFFDIGGHSLKATQLVSRVYRELNVQLDINDVFEYPTIEELANRILQSSTDSFVEIPEIENREYYDILPNQKRLWVLSQFEDGKTAYNINAAFNWEGKLNRTALQKALNELVARHESLRTNFVLVNGEVQQRINSKQLVQNNLQFIELLPTETIEEDIKDCIKNELKSSFDLGSGSLFKIRILNINSERQILIFTAHHIVFDGWSLQVLFRELTTLYNAFVNEKANPLKPLRIQYKDYAAWQLMKLEESEFAENESFWLKQFAGEIPTLNLPTDFQRPQVRTHEGKRMAFSLDSNLFENIQKLARQKEASPYMILLASLKTALYRYSGQSDIIIGTSITGREHIDLENQIGFYLNTLAIRTQFEGSDSFNELLANLKSVMLETYKYQHCPFDHLVHKLNLRRDTSRSALFDVLVNHLRVQDDNQNQESLQGIHSTSISLSDETVSKYDLEFEFYEHDNHCKVNIVFNTSLFTEATISRLKEHYLNILMDAMNQPEKTLDNLTLISGDEIAQIDTFSKSDSIENQEFTFLEGFVEMVLKHPTQIAVVDGKTRLTYLELHQRSNQLAHFLRAKGITTENIVPILLDRSTNMLIAMLGILKSGAAYLPIDTDYPQERIEFMVTEAQAKWMIVDRNDRFKSNTLSVDLLNISSEEITQYSIENLTNQPKINDLAYLIYTSGSTGTPKGVMVEHDALSHYANTFKSFFGLTDADKVIQQSSVAFDTMVEEVFPALISGSTIVIVKEGGKDIQSIKKLIVDEKITILSTTPMVLGFLNNTLDDFGNLRYIISGGDVLQFSQINNFYGKVKVVNTYGPTETTVCATYNLIESPETTSFIGKPIAQKQMEILGKSGEKVPVGVVGELYIGGRGLSRGYINQPTLTKEKFVVNSVNGQRFYRTGDFAKWMPDGNIAFVGRADNQVKVRGYRIELEEVEKVLSKLLPVQNIAVVAKTDDKNEKRLCAYLTLNDAESNVESLKQQAFERLPQYMIPSHWVVLETMPLTITGKINRKVLPAIDFSVKQTRQVVKPSNRIEEKLLTIWEDILDRSNFGITDNFFELGGHSVKAFQMLTEIEEAFEVDISLQTIFNLPTIRQIAQSVEELLLEEMK